MHRYRSLAWWLAAGSVAMLLKQYYSTAPAADLDWVLRPLALLLEAVTGQGFRQDSSGEWLSVAADVRLVKTCAGINFMLMSLLAYAWLFRPDREEAAGAPSWLAGQALLLGAAAIAAWATGLLANTLRILLAMTARARGWEFDAIGVDAQTLHRLIGMLVYVPLLALQLRLCGRSTFGQALAIPALLYLSLLGLVPLLTGNAFHDPARYLEHLWQMCVFLAALGGCALLGRAVLYGRRSG